MKILRLAFFSCLVIALFSGCKGFSPAFDTSGFGGGQYYLNATMDGKSIAWKASVSGNTGYVVGTLIANGSIDALIGKMPDLAPLFGFQFDANPNSTDFNQAITTGSIPLATSYQRDMTKQWFQVNYTDENGDLFSSLDSRQTGQATVVSVTKIPVSSTHSRQLQFKITFSCKLYPEEFAGNTTGKIITITNGEALLIAEEN